VRHLTAKGGRAQTPGRCCPDTKSGCPDKGTRDFTAQTPRLAAARHRCADPAMTMKTDLLIQEAKSLAKTVIPVVLIALILRTFLFQPFTIPSDSMEPALRDGDYMVAAKYSYGWSRFSLPLHPPLFSGRIAGQEPRRGDIIVFKLPREKGRVDYVKRLIGLPGDRVQLTHGVVWLNGRPLPQKPLGWTQDPNAPSRQVMRLAETLPDGRTYSVFREAYDREGDNTGVYIVPKDHYFFMGDNRDNSLDSRWPDAVGVGFVPAENLVGKAPSVLLSWRDGTSVLKPWTWITHLDPQRFLLRLE
jgi:signal peptidase I